jgi:hypothetical protein
MKSPAALLYANAARSQCSRRGHEILQWPFRETSNHLFFHPRKEMEMLWPLLSSRANHGSKEVLCKVHVE